IPEDNPDAPDSLRVNIDLPASLKSRIRRIATQAEPSVKKNLHPAEQLIDECIRTSQPKLDLTGYSLGSKEFEKGSPISEKLASCTELTSLVIRGDATLSIFPDVIF